MIFSNLSNVFILVNFWVASFSCRDSVLSITAIVRSYYISCRGCCGELSAPYLRFINTANVYQSLIFWSYSEKDISFFVCNFEFGISPYTDIRNGPLTIDQQAIPNHVFVSNDLLSVFITGAYIHGWGCFVISHVNNLISCDESTTRQTLHFAQASQIGERTISRQMLRLN